MNGSLHQAWPMRAAGRARLHRAIDAIVVIPARDEAATIRGCLDALADQQDHGNLAVLVGVNNSRDDTLAATRAHAAAMPFPVVAIDLVLAANESNAGGARRAAMDIGLDLLGGRDDGLLFATDADARPAPDWISNARRHIKAGCDAVAGQAALLDDAADPLPAPVVERSRAEARLLRLIDRSASLVDPCPWDPWPRHANHWGASFAVTAAAYRRVGGIPRVPLAEDRAFFDQLDRCDARVRHADDVVVHVLARRQGRAPGGMADVLDRRCRGPDALCDAMLMPVRQAVRRARVRRALRVAAGIGTSRDLVRLGASLGVDHGVLDDLVRQPCHGQAWARLCEASPALQPRRLAHASLASETRRAERLVRRLTGMPPDRSCDPPFMSLV
jgi:hypothetical protein